MRMCRIRKFASAAILAASIAFVATRFLWTQFTLARADASGGGKVAVFLLVSLAVSLGPGLLAWRVSGLTTKSPAAFAVFVVATSLGFSMLAPWLLLLCGLWTRWTAIALAVSSGALAVASLASWAATAERRRSAMGGVASALLSTSLSEAIALALALAVGELLFELLAGTTMAGWDAFLSWDRWAGEFAAADSLGRRALGFYPPGIPLLGSVFYKILPPTGPVPASTAHLLLHGFHAVFPLLLLLSVCALARQVGFNPLVGEALVLSDFFLVQAMLKQSGEADVPLAALCVAAIVVAMLCSKSGKSLRVAAAAVPALFAFAFAKGNGFAVLAVVAAASAAAGKSVWRPAVAAVAISAPFFLQQAVLALFPSLAVHNPLLLALPLETAHTDLFSPGIGHLLFWLGKAGPILCLGGGLAVSLVAAAVSTALTLAAVADRRARPIAIAAVLWFALWFFTGSYDWRNAIPAHVLACAAAAASVQTLATMPRSTAARAILAAVAIVASLALLSRQRLPALAARLGRKPVAPGLLKVAETDRPAAISSLRPYFPLMAEVPFLRDAPHLILPGRDYRLVGNGVRGLPYGGADTFASPAAGDLALSRRSFFAATEDYEPVSRLSARSEFGETLHLFRPVREKTPFRAEPVGGGEIRLELSTSAASGFIEILLSSTPPPGFSISPVRDGAPAAFAAFDSVFRPWRKGAVVRLPFWFPPDAAPPRAFAVKVEAPVPISSVSLLK